ALPPPVAMGRDGRKMAKRRRRNPAESADVPRPLRTHGFPHGDERVRAVADANVMVARVCLLCYVAAARGILFIVEQPVGSRLELHKWFQKLSRDLTLWRHTIHMHHFGGASDKPTWLYCNERLIEDLSKYSLRSFVDESPATPLVHTWYDKSGRRRIAGNSNLKKSQAYPTGFGRAVACLYQEHSHFLREKAAQTELRGLGLHAGGAPPGAPDCCGVADCLHAYR
ncbi:unnamed protein product, partial [Prorocentrum cordatum]